MRRLLLVPVVALAFASVPAANAYLINGCQSGDWRAVDLVVAGREIAEVCTSSNPLGAIHISCTPVTCR